MKEKRYFCDCALSYINQKSNRLVTKVVFIFIFVTIVSSLIYYNIISEDFEAYSENAYEYLNEIADNVIEKDGINLSMMPEDVVEYKITYKDDKIIFQYSLGNNKEKIFVSASMKVTLSKNFEILSKGPTYSSKEEYLKSQKIGLCLFIFAFGLLTGIIMIVAIGIFMGIAILISIIYKKKDIKENFS